jgi:hypothetical protein
MRFVVAPAAVAVGAGESLVFGIVISPGHFRAVILVTARRKLNLFLLQKATIHLLAIWWHIIGRPIPAPRNG